jgi:hypothetical protein
MNVATSSKEPAMTQRIPENFSAAEWRPVTIMGNTMRPRDPNDVQALSCGRGQSFGHKKNVVRM